MRVIKEGISKTMSSVIPACRVAAGDSPRRESFFKKDAGQAGMTKKRVLCAFSYGLMSKILSIYVHVASLLLILSLHACSLPRIVVLDDPLSPEEHLNLGVTYEKNGEYDAAIAEYEKASKKLPAAYLYMGNVFFQKNEYEKAETYYRKAIEKDPKNADAYNNLAWLYYAQKRNLNEARSLAEKAIELNPSKKDIYQDTLNKIIELK